MELENDRHKRKRCVCSFGGGGDVFFLLNDLSTYKTQHSIFFKWITGHLGHSWASSERTPSSSSLALAMASQPLLACGFLGDGCIIPSTRTSTPAADRVRRARCSATRPTPITMEIPNASTAWHSAVSQRAKSDALSATGSSGGVKFLPLALMKMSGQRLCTKQCWKKSAGSPHSFLKKPQKRAPLTSVLVQESPLILRLGCSSGGWPTSPVIFSQSTTDLTSPKGTCADGWRWLWVEPKHHYSAVFIDQEECWTAWRMAKIYP